RQPRQLDGGNAPNKMAATPPTSRGESRQQAGGNPANFLTGDYTESTQESTQEITQKADEKNSVDNFSKVEPCPDDENLARWFWARILELHERAAEYDGMLARPEEPDWPAWTNEIR
ncbi:hypothetical protein COJ96_25690, partial [Bacillus sp. AFS073361]|uniref:hypothetical protein n=1 Tax=Bacillus sp. AFS073361 TaxID=2033511 RepID=UPI000C004322